MARMYDKAGNPVDVPDEQVQEKFLSRELFFRKGEKQPISFKDGRVGYVPASELAIAFSKGWKYDAAAVEAKKHGGPLEQAKAFAEGAANLVPGAPTIEAAGLGNLPEQQRRARIFPGTKVAGEVAAVAAATLATEGAAAPAAARAVLPRVAGVAARGALEAGAQGAVMEMNRQLLGEEKLSSQKILSSAGTSALFGGGASGVLHVAGALAKGVVGKGAKAFSRAPSTKGAGTAADAIDAISVKQAADPSTFWGRARDAIFGKDDRAAAQRLMSREWRDLASTPESSADRIAIETADGFELFRRDMGQALKSIDTVKEAEIARGLASQDPLRAREVGFNLWEELNTKIRFMKHGDGSGAGGPAAFANAPAIAQLEDQAAAMELFLGIHGVPTGKVVMVGGTPSVVMKKVLDLGKPVTAADVWKGLDAVRGRLGVIQKLDDAVPRIFKAAADEAGAMRMLVKGVLEDKAIFGDAAVAQSKYNRLISRWKDADSDLGKKLGAGIDSEYVGGRKYLPVDGAKFQKFSQAVGSPEFEPHKRSLAEAVRAAREIGDELLADDHLQARLSSTYKATAETVALGRAMADLKKVRGKAQAWDRVVSSALGGAFFGPIGAVVGSVQPFAASSVVHLLDSLARKNSGRITVLAGSIARRGKALKDRSPLAALAILEASRFADREYAEKPKNKKEAYARRAAEIRRFAENPIEAERLMRARVEPFAAEVPEHAEAMVQQGLRSLAYLATKLPAVADAGAFSTRAPHAVLPSESDIHDFAQAVRVIEDPVAALEDLARGHLSISAADTLRATSPELFEEMKGAVVGAIAESGKPIDYKMRLQLGLFFGEAFDPSLNPTFIAHAQASYAPPPAPPQGQQGNPQLRSTRELKSVKHAASAAQALDAKRERVA